jgi:GNAT superfamily N-acetyltransferase
VASRHWSYRDLLTEAELETLSVEETTADFAEGLAELPSGSAVFVAELAGRVVGYAYVLPSPDANVPEGTTELGSLYVTEDVAGTGVARTLMDAAIEQAGAADQGFLTIWVRRENGRARRFYEKHGMRQDGAERSGPHDVMPIEIHEIRYRMQLEPRRPQRGTRTLSSTDSSGNGTGGQRPRAPAPKPQEQAALLSPAGSTAEIALLDLQVDPEKDQGPQEDREDCRDDRLQLVEMVEVVFSSRNDQADDDVEDEEHCTKRAPAPHARSLLSSPSASQSGPGSRKEPGRPGLRSRSRRSRRT